MADGAARVVAANESNGGTASLNTGWSRCRSRPSRRPGRVLRAAVNFDIGSLSRLSGIYEFKYNDIEELRRDKGYSN